MSIPIKLTENDFSYIHWDKDSGGPESFELIIHGESKSNCNTVKQQILDNQEIINIVKEWAQSEPISISNGIKLTHTQLKIRRSPVYRLINLIKDKTGVDIGESS